MVERLAMEEHQDLSIKNTLFLKDESDAHILQRLKDSFMKPTYDQHNIRVGYHVKQDEVIWKPR
jgi:hypothetical protein